MYRKDAMIRVGGFCEDFIGWGGEDDFQSFKTKMFLKWTESPAVCYHLWHAKVVPDMMYYQRNLQLLNRLVNMKPDEVQKYISSSATKIGMKNKYYDK